PREADLIGVVVDAEAQRILNRPLDRRAWNSRRPVRSRQELMNYVHVELRSIRADQKSARLHHHHRCHVTLAPRFKGNRYSVTCAGTGIAASRRASATG